MYSYNKYLLLHSDINIRTMQMDVPQLTALGTSSMSTLLYPPVRLLEMSKFDHLEDVYATNKFTSLPSDVHLVTASLIIQQFVPAVGLVFHRTQTTQCYGSNKENENNSNAVSDDFCLFHLYRNNVLYFNGYL